MNRLSPEKRNHLILAAVGTVAALALIFFLVIRPQKDALVRIDRDKTAAVAKLQEIEEAIKKAPASESELANAIYSLSQAETDIASGDPYAWVNDIVRRFKANYKGVDIPVIPLPVKGEVEVLTGIPYQQLKVTLNGTAYYHDLGKFVSELENTFPHVRVVNIMIEPAGSGGDNEKLSFRFDFVALIKTQSS
jgi:hypothetical protein